MYRPNPTKHFAEGRLAELECLSVVCTLIYMLAGTLKNASAFKRAVDNSIYDVYFSPNVYSRLSWHDGMYYTMNYLAKP